MLLCSTHNARARDGGEEAEPLPDAKPVVNVPRPQAANLASEGNPGGDLAGRFR